MARSKSQSKREVPLDQIYNSALVTQFINTVMKDGKKSKAEKIVYGAIKSLCQFVRKKNNQNQQDEKKLEELNEELEILNVAIKNVTPLVEVMGRRVGGSTYQVPVEIRANRAIALAIRWLIQAATVRAGKSMLEKLSFELTDAYNGRGAAIKKKEDTHRMAEANRAFAHFGDGDGGKE